MFRLVLLPLVFCSSMSWIPLPSLVVEMLETLAGLLTE
jgi:hypothetical protein